MLFGLPRPATITCVSMCTVYVLTKEAFDAIVMAFPSSLDCIIKAASRQLLQALKPEEEEGSSLSLDSSASIQLEIDHSNKKRSQSPGTSSASSASGHSFSSPFGTSAHLSKPLSTGNPKTPVRILAALRSAYLASRHKSTDEGIDPASDFSALLEASLADGNPLLPQQRANRSKSIFAFGEACLQPLATRELSTSQGIDLEEPPRTVTMRTKSILFSRGNGSPFRASMRKDSKAWQNAQQESYREEPARREKSSVREN